MSHSGLSGSDVTGQYGVGHRIGSSFNEYGS